jgi:hypothetical protein
MFLRTLVLRLVLELHSRVFTARTLFFPLEQEIKRISSLDNCVTLSPSSVSNFSTRYLLALLSQVLRNRTQRFRSGICVLY